MAVQDNPTFQQAIVHIREGMVDFITPGETPYTRADALSCEMILNQFLIDLDYLTGREASMVLVRSTVESLNTLNARCEHVLIEKDERVEIASIISSACHRKGVSRQGEDVTEEWRRW